MGFYISLATNGIFRQEVSEKILQSPIDWIIVSLDGPNEKINASIRGEGHFQETQKTIEALAFKNRRKKNCKNNQADDHNFYRVGRGKPGHTP